MFNRAIMNHARCKHWNQCGILHVVMMPAWFQPLSENLIIQHVLVWEHAFHACNVIIHVCMCFHERIVFIREWMWKGHDAESRGIDWFHDCNDSRLESWWHSLLHWNVSCSLPVFEHCLMVLNQLWNHSPCKLTTLSGVLSPPYRNTPYRPILRCAYVHGERIIMFDCVIFAFRSCCVRSDGHMHNPFILNKWTHSVQWSHQQHSPGCSVFRANHAQCTLNHPTCVLIRIASIEHITADTIRIISMNNIIVHGIILIIRLIFIGIIAVLIWFPCRWFSYWNAHIIRSGWFLWTYVTVTLTDSLNAERETMLTLDSS